MIEDEIRAFVRERDEMLLACDVDEAMAFHAKWNPGYTQRREIAEIGLHKARTAALSLPMEERVKSYRWLTERGYGSLDGGDVKAEAERTAD